MKVKWNIRAKLENNEWYSVHYNAVSLVRTLLILFKCLKKYDLILISKSKIYQ